MSTLKGLVRSASGPNLVVTGPHTQWLERLEHEQMPNRKALLHMIRVLLRDYKHERSGRFSPSAMGECARRIVFGYAGAPQLPPDLDNQEMMDHGTEAHLKWQMEGLTMGYMTEAEVWVHDDDLLSGGSMDALLYEDSVLELKTAGLFIYNKIVTRDMAPKWENLLQLHNYFLLADKDWGSLVYEDRSGGQFHEFRVERDVKIEAEVLRRLGSYKRYVEDDLLPPQLDMCEQRTGTIYKRCPYRFICPTVSSVTAASALVSSEHGRSVPAADAPPTWAESILAFIEELPEDQT